MTDLRAAAERIFKLAKETHFNVTDFETMFRIESVLREVVEGAEENAYYKGREEMMNELEERHAKRVLGEIEKVRAEAIEKCAKIADERKFYDPEGFLASRIRALKP